VKVNETIVAVAVLAYNFALAAGTAYLVAIHDWSMWTFLLAMFFIISFKHKNDNEDKK
jgi:hypothetical protein